MQSFAWQENSFQRTFPDQQTLFLNRQARRLHFSDKPMMIKDTSVTATEEERNKGSNQHNFLGNRLSQGSNQDTKKPLH